MGADALSGQPRITAAITEAKLVPIPNNVVKAFNAGWRAAGMEGLLALAIWVTPFTSSDESRCGTGFDQSCGSGKIDDRIDVIDPESAPSQPALTRARPLFERHGTVNASRI
jgi:hypothetical protein